MVNTYDPKDVNVVVDGTILTGFADGTFVSIEQEEENYTMHVGAQGEVSRARSHNRSGTITVTLSQDSPSNTYLNRKANSKETFSVAIVDMNTDETHGGNNCWIEKPADKEFGKEVEEREWVIVVPKLESN